MKKIRYILIFLVISTLLSCQSVEIVPISTQQSKVSQIMDYILTQSIYNLETEPVATLSLDEIVGSAYSNLELQKNEIPFLSSNLEEFDIEVHNAYISSLFEIQQTLIYYSQQIEFPLIYPDVDNKYTIDKKTSVILFEQYRDEIFLEINSILEKNLEYVASLYKHMSYNYNIYCYGLENLNRPSPPTISTNITPRMKTVFIKVLINELAKNEEELDLLNKPLDLNTITII